MLLIWQKPSISCKDEAYRRQVLFVREILDEDDIELQKIHMKENPTDTLTKVVLRVKFAYCKELLQIFPVA